MALSVNLKPALEFLEALKRNNNRTWFQTHRDEYEDASLAFETFVGALIDELRPTEGLRGLTPKDCIFRIYRDIRFSKDKTPYKDHMGAYIAPGGRKATRMGYYVHVSPGDSLIAGGLHQPDAKRLDRFRQAIVRDARPFKKIVGAKAFREYLGEVEGEKLKSAPRGYSTNHPEIELLRLKQVTVHHRFSDGDMLGPDIVRKVIKGFKRMKPFLVYLDAIA
jgi:uncharacterized protein (TIGR02453 family)